MSTRSQSSHEGGYKSSAPFGRTDFEAAKLNSDYKRYSTFSSAEWGLEILSSSVSLGLFCAIVAVLWSMDNKPLADWPISSISPNAVISILTTACSAAMMHSVSASMGQLKWLHFKNPHKLFNLQMFDEASRGPYGSVKLLAGLKLNLATVGALVTIFRLGFSPLTQQVINLPLRDVITVDSTATVGFAHSYSRPWPTNLFDMIQDVKMESAISTGLYDVDTPPQFNCSGTCMWDTPITSLGFKSSCKNVTVPTLKTMTCEEKNGGDYCNMTTPAGVTLGLTSVNTTNTTGITMFSINAENLDPSLLPGGAKELPSLGIAKLAVYRVTGDPEEEAGTTADITDCNITLTVYEYSNAKANGSSFSFGSIEEVDLGDMPWGVASDASQYFINETKLTKLPPISVGVPDLFDLKDFFLSDNFRSEWVAGIDFNSRPGFTVALWKHANISQAFETMATKMTDYIRNGPNMQLATGKRVDSVAFLQVRWYWLIGPAAIELSALVSVIFTIKCNTAPNVPLWKSSTLAVLACQHEEDRELIHAKINDIKEIEKSGKDSKAQLE